MTQNIQIRALIVDDVEDIQDIIKMYFNRLDASPKGYIFQFNFQSVYQGQDAVDLVKQSNEPFDLIFMDMRMPPGISGSEAIDAIWTFSPEIPICVCSAYSDEAFSDLRKRHNNPEHLIYAEKPFPKDFKIKVINLLDQSCENKNPSDSLQK